LHLTQPVVAAGRTTSSGNGRTHRVLRGIFWTFVALLGLLIALLAVAHTPSARRFAVNQVAALLSDSHISLQTDELRYNLFSLSFDLRNVRLGTVAADMPPFATIQRARIDFGLGDILRRRYVVQSGSAEGVTIHYFVNADGIDNLPRPPSDPNQPEQALDYLIADFRIPNAQVRYQDESRKLDVVLPQSSVEVRGNALTDRHQVQLEVGAGEVAFQERRAVLDGLRGTLSLGDDDLTIERLDLRALGSHAELSGAVASFDSPVADVKVRADVDVERAASLVPATQALGGRLALDGFVRGALSAPAIEARVHGSELTFQNLTDGQLDLTGAFDLTSRRARVSSFEVEGAWGTATAEGEVSLDASQRSRLRATIERLDVAAVSQAIGLPYAIASRWNHPRRLAGPRLSRGIWSCRGETDHRCRPGIACGDASGGTCCSRGP
jgi:hypothetical protein